MIAIPDRIQKAKSVGTDKSKKNNTVKSILGNVQSNVQTPLYLRKGDTAEVSLIQKVENERENLVDEKDKLIESNEVNFLEQADGDRKMKEDDQNVEKKHVEEKADKEGDSEEERKILGKRQRAEEHSLLLEYSEQKALQIGRAHV